VGFNNNSPVEVDLVVVEVEEEEGLVVDAAAGADRDRSEDAGEDRAAAILVVVALALAVGAGSKGVREVLARLRESHRCIIYVSTSSRMDRVDMETHVAIVMRSRISCVCPRINHPSRVSAYCSHRMLLGY
jgi:hypothetical protein